MKEEKDIAQSVPADGQGPAAERETPVQAPASQETAAAQDPAAERETPVQPSESQEAAAAQEVSASQEAGTGKTKEEYTRSELKKRRRKNIVSLLVSLLIIGLVVYALVPLSNSLEQGDSTAFTDIIARMNWWYLLVAVLLCVLMFATDTLKYTLLTRSYGYKLGIAKDMKVALIGKYYEAITPFSTGGQPMQIYYFYKNGIPGTKSTSVTMVKYAVQMLAVTVACAVIMGAGMGALDMVEETAVRNTILICGWVGFGINAFIPVFVTFIVFCPRPVTWLINLFIRLLYKTRIVKNAEKLESAIRKWMDDFAIFSQFIYKKPLTFLLLFLLCLCEPLLEFSMPYFLLVAMCGGEIMGLSGGALFFAVMALSMYATYSAAFIPTPGNSGAVETVFMLAFTAIADSVLFWYVLAWRFLLYYSYILIGFGTNIYDVAARIVRERREDRAAPAPADKGVR